MVVSSSSSRSSSSRISSSNYRSNSSSNSNSKNNNSSNRARLNLHRRQKPRPTNRVNTSWTSVDRSTKATVSFYNAWIRISRPRKIYHAVQFTKYLNEVFPGNLHRRQKPRSTNRANTRWTSVDRSTKATLSTYNTWIQISRLQKIYHSHRPKLYFFMVTVEMQNKITVIRPNPNFHHVAMLMVCNTAQPAWIPI